MNDGILVYALILLSGIAWTTVYAEAIRLGFRQRTYAIPAAALALNIAWEWQYAVIALSGTPGLQGYVNLLWGVADLVIVYTFLRFGYAEFSARLSRGEFFAGSAGLLAAAVTVQLLFLAEFGDRQGAIYSAFLQNLLMSGLFIAMFLARGGSRGQSLTIAVAKWIGTLAPTIQWGLLSFSPFVLGVGLACSVIDLAYIGLVLRDRRRGPAVRPATAARAV